jgi:hypothetical protein
MSTSKTGRRLPHPIAFQQFLAAVLCTAVLGFSGHAHAANKPSNKAVAKARQLAVVAKERAKAKRFDLAAEMFHEAFVMNPNAWAFLFSAARCEQLHGVLDDAKRDYTRYLSYSKGDHGLRARAQGFLMEVEAALMKRKAAKAQAVDDQATAQAQADSAAEAKRKETGSKGAQAALTSNNTKAYALLGVGGAALGVGAFLLVKAAGDQSDLDAKMATLGAGGKITGITLEQAQELQDSAELSRNLGVGALITGAVVAGVGGYLLATAPTARAASLRLDVSPVRDGAIASLQFAF